MGLTASWAISTAFYGSYLSDGFRAGRKKAIRFFNWIFGFLAFFNIIWIAENEYIDYLITFVVLGYLLFVHVIYFKNLKEIKKGES